jgi:hypothetical protein
MISRRPAPFILARASELKDLPFWLDPVEILRSDLTPAEKARKLGDLGHDTGDCYETVSTWLSAGCLPEGICTCVDLSDAIDL